MQTLESWSFALLAAIGIQDLEESAGIVDSNYNVRRMKVKKIFFSAFYVFDACILYLVIKSIFL